MYCVAFGFVYVGGFVRVRLLWVVDRDVDGSFEVCHVCSYECIGFGVFVFLCVCLYGCACCGWLLLMCVRGLKYVMCVFMNVLRFEWSCCLVYVCKAAHVPWG